MRKPYWEIKEPPLENYLTGTIPLSAATTQFGGIAHVAGAPGISATIDITITINLSEKRQPFAR
jgi:hypothetical protein